MAKKMLKLKTVPKGSGRRHWRWAGLGVVMAIAAAAVAMTLGWQIRATLPKTLNEMTAQDLAGMTDPRLARVDPLVMNLIVAREIPGLEKLDIAKYVKTVDEWAKRIDEANRAAEPRSKHEATYRMSREFWMAGGMAVMLAGPAFGIGYTREGLNPGKPEQQFVHGVIEGKQGTCATMPVVYMAIGHRLGWPIRAVVSRDHMWARWDDGVSSERGGRRFNLEATNAKSSGGEGSFASLTDEEYAKWLETPRRVIASGSDMTSLTARQTLGVFLQGRAGYWKARGDRVRAGEDLALAVKCFPENGDIRGAYLSLVLPREESRDERNRFRAPRARRPADDVERIQQENREAMERMNRPPVPVDPLEQLWKNPAWPGASDPNLHLQPPR